jgi:hypothetical protein
MKRLLALWRNRHLQPKTSLSRFPPVHRVDLEGRQRVDSGCLTGRSVGAKRKICTTSALASEGS